MTIEDGLDEIRKKDEIEKLKKEKKKAESKAKQLESELEDEKQHAADLNRMIADYKRKLAVKDSDAQHEIIKAHLRAISNFWPGEPKDEIDEGIIKLINDPEFIEIYKNAVIINSPDSRIEYITMKVVQKGIANMFNFKGVIERLAPLGLNMTCLYRIEKKESITGYACVIGGEEIDAGCTGSRYDRCKTFTDFSRKVMMGEKQQVKMPKTYNTPELIINDYAKEQIETALLDEIDEYWRDE